MASDHFIPRFYLNNFQIPNRSKWIYSYKRNLQPKPLAIKSLACEDDYYTLKAKEVLVSRTMPDEFLSMGEDAAAPILKELLTASRLNLSEGAKIILAVFIAYLAVRTPVARARAINVRKAMYLRKLQVIAAQDDFVHVVMNELKLAKTEEEAEGMRQIYLNPEKKLIPELVGDVDDFSLERAFRTGEVLANILLNMKNWVLVEGPSAQVFVTSDNPFVVLAPEPYVFRVDLNPENAECLLPISPRRAILFTDKVKGNSLYRIKRERMASWVKQTISFGYESVFASISAAYIQREFDRIPAGAITEVPLWTIPPPPLKKDIG
jgi:hypothetical protein